MKSLNFITLILIIASAGLTFIILYNLMNIMLKENYKELATLKALGLFDYQVTQIIFYEVVILASMGIILGLILGQRLNQGIVSLLSRDDLMFHAEIYNSSYVYSVGLAYTFIILVTLLIHRKIKRIDKVEAMKDMV